MIDADAVEAEIMLEEVESKVFVPDVLLIFLLLLPATPPPITTAATPMIATMTRSQKTRFERPQIHFFRSDSNGECRAAMGCIGSKFVCAVPSWLTSAIIYAAMWSEATALRGS